MPKTIRFHLDENVHGDIAYGLRSHGIDVTTAKDARLIGASDTEHIAFALSAGRVIFTHDRDFLKLHAAGVTHAGIVYCQPNRRTLGQIIQDLRFIFDALDPEDMADTVEFI